MWILPINQILTENHVNITNHSTISSRHGPHAIRRIDAAITTRLWAGTDEQNVRQTLREAPALKKIQVGNREDVSEGWTRNDLVTWLSEKGCWMKTSLTSELKQTIMKKTQSVRNMNKPWSWKVTQGEKLSEEQPQCESENRLETKLAALPHHFTKKTASDNAQTLQARHPGQPCKMIQPSQHPHWQRNTCFLMCPNMPRNTVPLGGHAHSHNIEHAAPPSQHLIEQTRTTTGRRSVALSPLTLRWRRREMS